MLGVWSFTLYVGLISLSITETRQTSNRYIVWVRIHGHSDFENFSHLYKDFYVWKIRSRIVSSWRHLKTKLWVNFFVSSFGTLFSSVEFENTTLLHVLENQKWIQSKITKTQTQCSHNQLFNDHIAAALTGKNAKLIKQRLCCTSKLQLWWGDSTRSMTTRYKDMWTKYVPTIVNSNILIHFLFCPSSSIVTCMNVDKHDYKLSRE